MRRKLTVVPFAVALGAVLVAVGCRVRFEPEAPDFVTYGWQLMGEQNYRGAIEQFINGTVVSPDYADGWNGLGWTYARLGRADTSTANFDIGADLADPSIVGTEILAGRSFSNLALGEFSAAVSDAREALRRAPAWVFRHDPTMTYKHLILTAATGFFGLGEFDSSLVWVRRLDDTFGADVSTQSGWSKLAIKLEALRAEL